MRRLKQLEAENARLKKFVAERDLEIEVMKEVAAKELVSVPARRRQVGHEEAVVIERMKELSAQYGGDDYSTYAGPDEQTPSDSSPTAEPT